MKKNKTYTLAFRRKREGKTNYRKRLRLLESRKPRVVIRKSLNNIQVGIVNYDSKGDIVLTSSHTKELERFGWKLNKGNIPSAYLLGYLAGKKALKKGIKNAILDLGFHKSVKGSRIYAALKGVLDSGLTVPHNSEILPTKERIAGEHILKYSHNFKSNKNTQNNQFSIYIENKVSLESIKEMVEQCKKAIENKFPA